MVEHYNYINEHYTKQHKKWTGDIIGNIIIIAEASALIITIIFKTINLPKEVCSIMNLSQISFTYITVSIPILVLIHTLRGEKAKIEIEHKEK